MTSPYICRNPALVRDANLARSNLTKDSDTLIPFLVISPTYIFASAQASTSAFSLPNIYTNVDM